MRTPFEQENTERSLAQRLAFNGVAVVVGAAATFGYIQWDAQQDQLAALTQMVEEMQQSESEALVTRNSALDLLSVAQTPVAAPATAIVEAPVLAAPTIDETTRREARRIETLATINAGVEELAAAVVAGEYDIHTNYEDEYFSGRIHFAFVGKEEDQTALERYIAEAAESGILAHSQSVVDSDGKVNGHILLFDLVEKSLENGTLEEQAAFLKMQKAAVDMLAKDSADTTTTDAAGDRYYLVQRGDSLAYIALQYYGNTNDYVRIFDANRDKLNSPERIQIGQILLIPSI